LPDGVIDLRRTAEPLNVINQDLSGAGIREQKRAQKVPSAAELEGSARMDAQILGHMKLVHAQICVSGLKEMVARDELLGGAI
jgi:hypothetical protein